MENLLVPPFVKEKRLESVDESITKYTNGKLNLDFFFLVGELPNK